MEIAGGVDVPEAERKFHDDFEARENRRVVPTSWSVDGNVAVVCAVSESQRFDVSQLAAKYEPHELDTVREPKRQWNAVQPAKRVPDEHRQPHFCPISR